MSNIPMHIVTKPNIIVILPLIFSQNPFYSFIYLINIYLCSLKKSDDKQCMYCILRGESSMGVGSSVGVIEKLGYGLGLKEMNNPLIWK